MFTFNLSSVVSVFVLGPQKTAAEMKVERDGSEVLLCLLSFGLFQAISVPFLFHSVFSFSLFCFFKVKSYSAHIVCVHVHVKERHFKSVSMTNGYATPRFLCNLFAVSKSYTLI